MLAGMAGLLWLVLISTIVAFAAAPTVRAMGFNYGFLGRVGDMMAVLMGGVAMSMLLSLAFMMVGITFGNPLWAIAIGFAGASLVVALMTIFADPEITDTKVSLE